MHRQEVVKLSDEEIRKELATLEHWELADVKLHREYMFENFIEAFGFMTKLAIVNERISHHPDHYFGSAR